MKKASVTTSKLNTYKKNYKRYIQQRQQQQQNQNANTNTNTKYKLVRRSNSQDNLQPLSRYHTATLKDNDKKLDDKLDEMRTRLTNLIEFKTKYYVDQRMITLMQSDDILTRGSNAISIASDWSTGSSAFMFKYNGETVAKITDGGVLYCKNIWMNGVNMLQLVNKVLSAISDGASIYVKHVDLKSGTYDMDINEAIMKHLLINADAKNTLEFIPQYNSAMLISTNRSTGIQLFNPNIVAAGNFTALAFGTANNQDEYAVLRYYNNATTANRYIGIGMNTSTNCLSIYQNKRVIINTGNSLDQCLLCKYSGNLANGKYLRIGCGDNRDTGIFAYGRTNDANYVYLKLQGRSASVAVYANYINFDSANYINYTSTNASGTIYYMNANSLAAGNSVCMTLGKNNTTANQSITIGYQHDTSNPLGWFGFYLNDKLITYDKYGNMNMNGLTTTSSISCAGLYSSADATIDGKVTCTQIDVANSVKNTWYAKLRVEDYLSNNDYIRFIMKDLGGQANIDLFHDTQYYGLRLKIDTADNTDDNKLCIYPTGVTIDGDLDCYDDVRIWETLEVAKDISVSNTSYGLRANNISAYSGGTVTVNSNIYIDNSNELQTDILNSAFDSYIQCKCSMEVSNEDNDAILSADNVTVYNDLQVGGVAVNDIATSADVNDNTKNNDTTLPTTAYVNAPNKKITAKQYELQSTTTDYYNGFGFNFKKVLMDTMYPIGSIYMSMVPLNDDNYYPETSPNNKFEVSWNGCTWQLIDNGVFLRNGEFHVLDVSGSVDPDDPNKYRYYITGAGTTGGNATHTHNLDRSHAYAKLSLHGNGQIKYDDLTVGSSWNSNYRIATGGSGAYESYNDPYGCGLGGRTENASTLPPYLTCYMYQRIA